MGGGQRTGAGKSGKIWKIWGQTNKLVVGPDNGNGIEIDDVAVMALYSIDDREQWFTLFNEDFQWINKNNDSENSGWRTKGKRIFRNNQKVIVRDLIFAAKRLFFPFLSSQLLIF